MKSHAALLGAASFLALCAASGAAYAQHPVSGVIVDERGAPLPGAQVRVRELGLTTATNRQGEFTFQSLPAGDTQIEISYLGLPTGVRDITVSATDANFITFTLADSQAEDRIVITGQILDGAARALNQQRTNDAITNIISADSIGRFPDYNIAEALQRVPGIGVERDQGEGNFISLRGAPSEFTSITVDGVALTTTSPDTRAVDLGTIPSDVVNGLEVSKTLLPFQEADSIAGSVNLVTRSPFDRRRLRINATVGASYNEFGGTSDQRASGVVSNVFGEGERFGALFSASWTQTDRRVDNIESFWNIVDRPEGDEILGVPEQEFKDYDTRRERIGLTGMLEFRPNDADRLYVRGVYTRRNDDEFRNLLAIVYEDGDLQPGATDQVARWNRVRYVREFRHRILRDETFTLTAGAEHERAGFTVDYAAAFTRSEQTYPRRQQLVFRSNARPDVTYDFAVNPDEPAISLFASGEHLDPSTYGFRQSTVRSQDTIQEEINLRANITIPGALFGNAAEHRFGALARMRDVSSDEEGFRDRRGSSAPALTLAELLSGQRSQNFGYHLGQKFNSGLVIGYFNQIAPTVIAGGERRENQSIFTDYEAEENIYAAYGMSRMQLNQTDVIFGLRVERTEFEGVAPEFNEDSGAVTIGRASNEYTNVFPNLTVRHAFSDNLIGRFALTRGISRPNYRDNVPRLIENSDGVRPVVEVERGNPDLRATLSNNVDLSLEYYFEPVGVISAGVFYKDLEDYEFTLVSNGQFRGQAAIITEKLNAEDGHIFGFEVNYQQQFTFLPGPLSNFGVFANYTWTDAEITLPFAVAGRDSSVGLPSQSRDTMNFAVFYETDRFNARLSYTDRSDYIDSFNLDPRLDTVWEGREQIDFTASFDVTDQVNVFLEAKNLTNSDGVRYAGARNRVTEREQFGYTLFGGLRFNF